MKPVTAAMIISGVFFTTCIIVTVNPDRFLMISAIVMGATITGIFCALSERVPQ